MTRSSHTETNMVERFLRTQRFRCKETRRIDGHLLRAFERFVLQQCVGEPLSVSALQHWLRAKRKNWPLHMVCHRARLVERFLEWAQANGAIRSSPFAELHRQFGRRTTPIVRALVCDDAEAALQRLRPLPRFGSWLGELMKDHVTLMHSLGYRYDGNEGMLLRFDRFLQNHAELSSEPLNKLAEVWSESDPTPNRLFESWKVRRLLSKVMHRLDPGVPIFSPGAVLYHLTSQQERQPYVYSDEEIKRVLQAALTFPSPKAPLRPLTLYTMLMLAYCAGLRVGEVAALTLADVQLQDETIEIRETKFFKHRRLPLAPGVIAALKHYLVVRAQAGAPMSPQGGLFWNRQRGGRYARGSTRLLLVQVLRRAGLKPPRGRVGPRIHDVRHTMVGHRMRDWYKEGINPQSRLPYLATFLGHKDINSTLVYLNTTPEVLHEASERFRKNGAVTLGTIGEVR
jgi:integrase/recombinase XerD